MEEENENMDTNPHNEYVRKLVLDVMSTVEVEAEVSGSIIPPAL